MPLQPGVVILRDITTGGGRSPAEPEPSNPFTRIVLEIDGAGAAFVFAIPVPVNPASVSLREIPPAAGSRPATSAVAAVTVKASVQLPHALEVTP